MFKLTTMAALAMAALLLLSAPPAQAQGAPANTYRGVTVVYQGTLGLTPGQTALITVPNFALQDGSVRFLKSTINVYDRDFNLIYQTDRFEPGHEVGHLVTLRHDHLPIPGELVTSRIQVWIEVESHWLTSTPARAEDVGASLIPPTFEVVDNASGRTILIGMLLPAVQKVRDKDGL